MQKDEGGGWPRRAGRTGSLTSEQKLPSWKQYCKDVGNSKQVINRWLIHLMEKTWVGAEDLGQLMFAFQDILTDLHGDTLAYKVEKDLI